MGWILHGLYIILVFIHELEGRNVPRVGRKLFTSSHSPLSLSGGEASVSDLTGYTTLRKPELVKMWGNMGKIKT